MKDSKKATEQEGSELNVKQKLFCENYVVLHNIQQAAIKAGYAETGAHVQGHRLLKNAKVRAYIKELQSDAEIKAGVSRLRVLQELEAIAFTDISELHNSWVSLEEFEKLTPKQRKSIASIETRVVQETRFNKVKDRDDTFDVHQVKIKLHDKLRALDSIKVMLGYNEPEKLNVGISDEPITGIDVH